MTCPVGSESVARVDDMKVRVVVKERLRPGVQERQEANLGVGAAAVERHAHAGREGFLADRVLPEGRPARVPNLGRERDARKHQICGELLTILRWSPWLRSRRRGGLRRATQVHCFPTIRPPTRGLLD